MRYPIRTKIILFTLIPILSAYALLFGLGLTEMRQQAREDARRWLAENAANHAYRVQLALAMLSEGTRQLATQLEADLAAQRTEILAVARLMDRIAVTPLANSAGLQLASGPGIFMARGMSAAAPLKPEQLSRKPEAARWALPPDGSPGVRYQYPLRGQGGILGSVFLQMSPQQLHLTLQQRQADSTRIYLLDEAGRYLLHGDPSLIGTPSTLSASSDNAVVSLQSWQGDEQTYLAALQRVEGTQWKLAVVAPEQALLEPMHARARGASALLLLTLTIIVGAVVLISSRALRPLEDLTVAVDEIARGNYRVSLPPQNEDEIGRVVQALKRTAGHQQRLQREHAAALEELQARMQARTRELGELIQANEQQQEALRLARDQAEGANRAKSEFLSNMSHELRTPLNGVLGYAQILRRDHDIKPRQRENLEAIESCGQHLLTLINDVLDLSKIEAGQMKTDIAPLDLRELCGDVHDIVAQRAHSKGLELQMELADDLPRAIESDATKLRQILLNLLGNAVKFTETGSIVLRVQRDTRQLHFEVEDSGIGIAEDQVEAIFDAFAQVENSAREGGTGLGLAISQHLLELLEGSPLSVSSEPGSGSVFSFDIPLNEVEAEDAGQANGLLADDSDLQLAQGQSASLLAVDDHQENLDILQNLLGDAGFAVETCSDAESGIARLREQRFDLVLMDIRMPGMSGLQAAELIRHDKTLKRIKLVAITASVFPEFREQALDSGFDDFIAKPFRAGELFGLLHKHLGVNYVHTRGNSAPQASLEELPGELAAALSKLIEQALEIGDMSGLSDVAGQLDNGGQIPPPLNQHIASLARQFDFDSLRTLSDRLRYG